MKTITLTRYGGGSITIILDKITDIASYGGSSSAGLISGKKNSCRRNKIQDF